MSRVRLRAAALAVVLIGVVVGLTVYFSTERVPPCLVSGATWRPPTDGETHRYEVVFPERAACFFAIDAQHRLVGALRLPPAKGISSASPLQNELALRTQSGVYTLDLRTGRLRPGGLAPFPSDILTATDDDGGTSQTNTTVHVSSSADLKREAILHIKALKERALERGDGRFLHELDEAERHVWKSLGYVNPFEPESVAPAPASNVSVGTGADDGVELRLDSSWNSKLASYTSIRLAWSNGVVTIVSLPAGLRDKEREFRVTPWVDSWHQDVRIETERKRGGGMTLEVEVREASMGFALSFDSDAVATFSFTYETRRLWTDATHLDPTFGHKVFDEERKAVNDLLCGGDERDDQEHDDSSGAIRTIASGAGTTTMSTKGAGRRSTETTAGNTSMTTAERPPSGVLRIPESGTIPSARPSMRSVTSSRTSWSRRTSSSPSS